MAQKWYRTVAWVVMAGSLSACAPSNPFSKPNYGTDSVHSGRRAPMRNATPYEPDVEEGAAVVPAQSAPMPLVPPPAPGQYAYAPDSMGAPVQEPFVNSQPMPPAPIDQPMAAPVMAAPMPPMMPAPQADYYAMEMGQQPAPMTHEPMQPPAMPPAMAEPMPMEQVQVGYGDMYQEQTAAPQEYAAAEGYQPQPSVQTIPLNPRPSKLGYRVLPDSRYAPRREAERWQR